jgi:hypothetical protein
MKQDGTFALIGSASAVAPTLPSGYIYYRLVSAVKNTSGNFVDYSQSNDIITLSAIYSTSLGSTGATLSDIDCTAYTPLIAKSIICGSHFSDVAAGAPTTVLCDIYKPDNTYVALAQGMYAVAGSYSGAVISNCEVPNDTGHVLARHYVTSGGGGNPTGSFSVFGFRLNI